MKRTQHMLIIIVVAVLVLSFLFSVAGGLSPKVAVLDDMLDSLQVGYDLISFTSASNPLIFVSKLLDAPVLPLLTVILATWFFEFINNFNLQEKIMLGKIKRMKGHVIVVPYNGFAQALLRELRAANLKAVTIAENRKDALMLYKEGEMAFEGDIRSIETFEIAGISRARCIVACAKDDVQNALIAITAKTENPSIEIISKANKEENLDRLGRAGSFKAVLADSMAGKEIGEQLIKRLVSRTWSKNEMPAQ